MEKSKLLFKESQNQIKSIYKTYLNDSNIDKNYFQKKPGSKIFDHLKFLLFLKERFSINDEISISIFDSCENECGHSNQVEKRIIFFSALLNFFSNEKQVKTNCSLILDNYIRTLILAIKQNNYDYLSILADSFSNYLNNAEESEVLVFFDSITKKQMNNLFFDFLKDLKLSKRSFTPENTQTITKNIVSFVNSQKDQKSADTAVEIAVNFIKEIKIDSIQTIQPTIDLIKENNLPHMNNILIALYSSLVDNNTEILNHKDDLINFVSSPSNFLLSLSILNEFFTSLIDEKTGHLKENIDESKDLYTKLLVAFISNAPSLQQPNNNVSSSLENLIQNSYLISDDETIVKLYFDAFLQGFKSIDVVHAILDSLTKKFGNYEKFIPNDLINAIPILKKISILCENNPKSEYLVHILTYLNDLIIKITKLLESVERVDEETALKQFMAGKQDPLEQAIQIIPFHRIERMSTLYCCYPKPSVRAIAYQVLYNTGEMFKNANTDWRDYDALSQPFIIRFTADINYISKKSFGKPIPIEKLIVEDGVRMDGICYLFKKVTTIGHPLFLKLYKYSLEYSKEITKYTEVLCALYSDELRDTIEHSDKSDISFLTAKQFINLIINNNAYKYLTRLSGTIIPFLIEEINRNIAGYFVSTESLSKLLRYMCQCWILNPQSFDETSCKVLINDVLSMIPSNKGSEISSNPDFNIAIGYFAHFTISKLHEPKFEEQLDDMLIRLITAIKKDTNHLYPELSTAAFNILLAIFASKGEFAKSHLPTFSQLSEIAPFDATEEFCLELLKRISSQEGKEEMAKEIIQSIILHSPTAVTISLLKSKTTIFDESFIFFSYLMCDEIDSTTRDLLFSYIKQKHKDVAEKYKNGISNINPVSFVCDNFPYVVIPILQLITSLKIPMNPKDLDEPVSGFRIYHLSQIIVQMLNLKPKINTQLLEKIVLLVINLTSQQIAYSSLSSDLWRSLMSIDKQAEFILKYTCSKTPPTYILDAALKAIEDKELLHKIIQNFHVMFFYLLDNQSNKNDKNILKSYYYVLTQMPISAHLILETCILIQMQKTNLSLSYIAKQYIIKIANIKTSELPKTTNEILDFFINICDEQFIVVAKQLALDFLSHTINQQAFHALVGFLISSIIVKPNKNLSMKDTLNETAKKVLNNFKVTSEFDQFFSSFYNVILQIIKERKIPKELMDLLISFGFRFSPLGLTKFNTSYLIFLVYAYRNKLIFENQQEEKQTIPNDFATQIINLLLYGDQIYTRVVAVFLPNIDINSLTDQVTKMWIQITQGTAVLTDENITKELFLSFKRAAVFGDYIVPEKLSILFRSSTNINEPTKNPIIADFVKFLLTSQEIPSTTAYSLINSIESTYGKVDISSANDPQPTFKDKLAELVSQSD